MKVAFLTSSRADYGIYYPLISKMDKDSAFEVELIVFGTHLSKSHGFTISQIYSDGFKIGAEIDSMPDGDRPEDISTAIGKTIINFTSFWKASDYDLVFSLGDRYEMFAACVSSIPFNINLAHIHGGEMTLGSIDEIFRTSLTIMSKFHFTSAEIYKQRVIAIKNSDQNVFNVGALSIDMLNSMELMNKQEFLDSFKIDLNIPSVLVTFHPETIDYRMNETFSLELVEALKVLESRYQVVITMPNADTMGNIVRKHLNNYIDSSKKAIGIESFGSKGYLTCMKYSSFMLGNTSSGFIEASYFPKPVINIGNRQSGRILTPNIISCGIQKDEILNALEKIQFLKLPEFIDTYGRGNTSDKIISVFS